jgi:hydroxyethylthiazole kinase-like uncharacterized protein yjeF
MKKERFISPRPHTSHKYSHGKVASIVGSVKYPGAALLSIGAMQKGGSGYITQLSISPEIDTLIISKHPEIVFAHNPSSLSGDSWLIGSGVESEFLSHHTKEIHNALAENARVAHENERKLCVTLDAAAIAFHKEFRGDFTIITPHEGELEAFGIFASHISNRKKIALDIAQEHNLFVVLKGFHTIIATPHGMWAMDTIGGSELAVAGSGDVLGGLIASFIGAFAPTTEKDLLKVLTKAVKAHSLAGRYAHKRWGNITASEIVNAFKKVIR